MLVLAYFNNYFKAAILPISATICKEVTPLLSGVSVDCPNFSHKYTTRARSLETTALCINPLPSSPT